MNDIFLAALTGALRRYGAEVRGDDRLRGAGGNLEFKTMLMIGLPRKVDENNHMGALVNNMLFASCPLPIGAPTPEERVQRTVLACRGLKSQAYMSGLIGFTNFVKGAAPKSFLRKSVAEYFSKHSLLVTQVPSATVPTTFPKGTGEVISEVQMVFPNIIPQVSIISYNGVVNANIVADPELFPEIDRVGSFWASELSLLAESGDP